MAKAIQVTAGSKDHPAGYIKMTLEASGRLYVEHIVRKSLQVELDPATVEGAVHDAFVLAARKDVQEPRKVEKTRVPGEAKIIVAIDDTVLEISQNAIEENEALDALMTKLRNIVRAASHGRIEL